MHDCARRCASLCRPACVIAVGLLLCLSACASTRTIEDPFAELENPDTFSSRQLTVMHALDEADPHDPQYLEILHGMMWKPGYTTDVREAALERLEQRDLDGLKRTIRQQLPRLVAWHWLTRLSEIIAERGWHDLTPALTSSWSRRMPVNNDDDQRPEYKALVVLYGEDEVVNVIFDLFVQSRSVAEQGLRARCWELLHRLGQRERLVKMVQNANVQSDDAMLIDLHAGAARLGIVPNNREEILWLRRLREPAHSTFWNEAEAAMAQMSARRRAELELRDLPIAVAASRHAPEMLNASTESLYRQLADYLQTQPRHLPRSSYANLQSAGAQQRLREYRDVLTWGDLTAMVLAIRALEVPQMVDHLFDYGDRDVYDRTTEYGGVISLDERGRFELLEFPPVIRRHDNQFIAPQAMLDAGYTSLFHFHYHAQRYRNGDHAGPGLGDLNYAENTRANCLVFTFINRNTLNIDYYRHGGIVVDLGEVRRR